MGQHEDESVVEERDCRTPFMETSKELIAKLQRS